MQWCLVYNFFFSLISTNQWQPNSYTTANILNSKRHTSRVVIHNKKTASVFGMFTLYHTQRTTYNTLPIKIFKCYSSPEKLYIHIILLQYNEELWCSADCSKQSCFYYDSVLLQICACVLLTQYNYTFIHMWITLVFHTEYKCVSPTIHTLLPNLFYSLIIIS